MDFNWLSQVFSWIVQVNTFISNFSSVLGSVTVLGAAVGFVLSRRDSGFGPKYDTTGRYNKFFKLIARKLNNNGAEKKLTPLRAEAFAAFATYESTETQLRYRAHFFPDGTFGVYLFLISNGSGAISQRLQEHGPRIRSELGLDKEPGFFSKLFRRSNQIGELKWEPAQKRNQGTVYRPVLYYRDEINITSAGRKLIRLSDWATQYLLDFQRIFDKLVPEVQAELKAAETPAPAIVAAAVGVEAAI